MSGVSASTGGSNVDLEMIVAGGQPFVERLDAFRQASKDAKDAKDALVTAKAEIAALMQEAQATKDAADKQLAENETAFQQLSLAKEEAEKSREKFDRKYAEIIAIMAEPIFK